VTSGNLYIIIKNRFKTAKNADLKFYAARKEKQKMD
jgi:hypothetical protein